MVDITIVFMGFINQQTSLWGHHLVESTSVLVSFKFDKSWHVRYILKISGMMAVYGLFIMYKAPESHGKNQLDG